jgi:poly-gamma-glutamate capsule biosynthesis protein CapA/YwtB (metallophosphatase superfamily)
MAGLGCNVINTGTNHTNDKGQGPITAELNDWDKIQGVLAVAGANRNQEEQQKVRYFEEKGVKFAFLSYSTYSNTPNPHPYSLNRFEDSLVLPQMQEAKANADIVIVSMRWGTEYSDEVNSAQISAAQKLAGLGADIILGHGTHTLQAVDRLTQPDGSETIVWYGLGNFLKRSVRGRWSDWLRRKVNYRYIIKEDL